MIYNDFKGKRLSMLGMGTMRFPTQGDAIDKEQTAALLDAAIRGGLITLPPDFPGFPKTLWPARRRSLKSS